MAALTDVQLGTALRDLASRGWVLVDTVVAAFQVADAARYAGQAVQISKAVKGWRVEVLRETEKPES